jgi:predicted amidohydrolase
VGQRGASLASLNAVAPRAIVRAVRVACAQIEPVLGDVAGNRERTADAIARAADAGADLVVLPELVTSGYVFHHPDEARDAAEPLDGPSLAGWRAAAERHGLLVAGGFCELGEDGVLYNSAAIVGAGGVLAHYRKVHLWDREPEVFTPGTELPPVIDTEHGRLGLMVCYDLEFPEWVRAAALAGAELLCLPTNWPHEARPEGERPMEVLRAMVSASTNRMFIAACDRSGMERDVNWVEGSVIAGPSGWPLAGPPSEPGPALLVADCDLAEARDKSIGPRNDVHADRRPELYAG